MLGWAFLVFMIGGVALVARGMRGRRVDDHPVCAACSFDLVGLLSADGPATTCPECGAPVAARRGVQWGRRRRQPWLIGAGAVMLATAAGLVAAPVIFRVSHGSLIRNAPYWYVKKRAMETTSGASEQYQLELMRRLRQGALDAAQIEDVADTAIAMQRRLHMPMWHWGDLFLAADAAIELSATQRQAYVDGCLGLELVARPTVAVGDPMVFVPRWTWRGGGDRLPFPTFDHWQFSDIEVVNLTLGGTALRVPPPKYGLGSWWDTNQPGWFDNVRLEPGEYELRAEIRHTWNDLDVHRRIAEPMASAGLRRTSSHVVVARVRVVPRGTPTVQLVEDASAQRHYARGIEIGRTNDESEVRIGSARGDAFGLPYDAVFRIEVQAGSERRVVGKLICRMSGLVEGGYMLDQEAIRSAALLGEPRIILVPDPDLAKHTADITRVWVGPEIARPIP